MSPGPGTLSDRFARAPSLLIQAITREHCPVQGDSIIHSALRH